MASRSYNLAFDNPYNRRIQDVLRKYDMMSDTNGEPDLMHYTNSRLQGGVQGGFMESVYFHPHLVHLADKNKDLPYTPLPRPRRYYADSLSGSGRPPGMVSPYVESVDPKSVIDSGTSAVYPIYNALELKAIGGSRCNCEMVEEMVEKQGGKKRKSNIGKTILKEVGPIVKDIASTALKELPKEAIKSSFKKSDTGSGRKRKNIKTQMEPEPKPEEKMSIAIVEEGGLFTEMGDKRSDKEKKEGAKKLQKLTKKVLTGKIGGAREKRAEIVKRIMKEHGMKLAEASKYVKEHNLYQKQ